MSLGTLSGVQAQIVAYKAGPSWQQPTVLQSGNGIPVVDIRTPNAGGLSHNAYGRFDVQGSGAILNNARVSTATQLGGWIPGNPWLATGTARIILNEVLSSRPSQLNGLLEVAGDRAQVVVANPAGIACAGCGFLNASRATLSTGVPQIDGGRLSGYRIESGTIRIDGAGMDARDTDHTELISRAVEINAGLWAQDLRVTTGANRIDAVGGEIVPLSSGSVPAPAFALDVARLGGMYAHRIHLIGTEAGVGVRTAGTIAAAAGEVLVTVDGTLTHRGVLMGHETHIHAGNIDTSGTLAAETKLSLASRDAIANSGLIQAGEEIGIRTPGEIANGGRIESLGRIDARVADGLDNRGEIVAAGDLHLSTVGTLDNSGRIQSGATLVLGANALANAASGEIAGANAILAIATDLDNRGRIDGGDVRIDAGRVANLGTGRLYGDRLAIAADVLDNRPEDAAAPILAARERLDLGVGALANADGALIFSAGDLAIGGTLDASGRATGKAGLVDNASATLEALGNLAIDAARLVNRKSVLEIGPAPATHTELPTGKELLDYTPGLQYHWSSKRPGLARWRDTYRDRYIGLLSGLLDGGLDSATRAALVSAVDAQPLAALADSHALWKILVDTLEAQDPEALAATIRALAQRLSGAQSLVTYWQVCANPDRGCSYISDVASTLTTVSREIVTAESPAGEIRSGGDMALAATALENRYSLIQSGGDMNLSGATLANVGAELHRLDETSATSRLWHWGNRDQGSTTDADRTQTLEGAVPAIIGAGGRLTGSFTERIDNLTIRQHAAPVAGASVRLPSAPGADAPPAHNPAGLPAIMLPANRLYRIDPGSTVSVLVETDPRFTNYRRWLSSDYLIKGLALDPATALKRLGDGFYEQRLVTEQIGQLTGRRFLDGFADDEEQYRALMDAGITFAREWQLIPGVALSAEQMAQLTTDIVWLVERSVVLADGTTQTVLAPQVYARAREGDLAPSGALIAGREVGLETPGDLVTSGTIAGRETVVLDASHIANLGGRIAGQEVFAQAKNDLVVYGGTIEAERTLIATAGGDLTVQSSTAHWNSAPGEGGAVQAAVDKTVIDRVAGLYVTGENGTLVAAAGGDLVLLAAAIANAAPTAAGTPGEGGPASPETPRATTVLAAGHDLVIGTVAETSNASTASKGNRWHRTTKAETGSLIVGNGNLALDAGNDLFVAGSTAEAVGNLTVVAAGNVIIASAANEKHSDANRGKKFTAQQDRITQQASHLQAGMNLSVMAGQDLVVVSSDLAAGGDATLYAGGDLALLAAQDYEYNLYEKRDKGSFGKKKFERNESTHVTSMGSTVTSGGDLLLSSEGHQTYQAAQLTSGANLGLAAGGDIDFEGVKDFKQESREKSKNSWAWTSAKGKGHTTETLRQSELVAAADLMVRTAGQIRIDVPEVTAQTVSQTIDALARADFRLSWLKEMEERGDIDWRQVKEAHDRWKYSHSGMGPGLALVIAIVTTMMGAPAISAWVGEGAIAGSAMAAAVPATATTAAVSAGWPTRQ